VPREEVRARLFARGHLDVFERACRIWSRAALSWPAIG
jgi:hypothetical protein